MQTPNETFQIFIRFWSFIFIYPCCFATFPDFVEKASEAFEPEVRPTGVEDLTAVTGRCRIWPHLQ